MEIRIKGVVYESHSRVDEQYKCCGCEVPVKTFCEQYCPPGCILKKKADQWQELDINNIPSDLFKNWEIEKIIHTSNYVLTSPWTVINPEYNYRIRPKESNKISNIQVEVKTTSNVNEVNIYKDGVLYFNTVSKKGNEDVEGMSKVCKDIIKEALYSTENNDAKTLEEKAEEYARSVVNKYNICGGTGLYWLNEVSKAYIEGAKSSE